MKARDWFILSFTFVVGALSGMYLYVTNFKPVYDEEPVSEKLEVGDLSVIGIRYGTRAAGASFRIEEDASYNYVPGDGNEARESGSLPGELFTALVREISAADLANLSVEVEQPECASFTDRGDTEYNIAYQGTEYTLDTCTTGFDESSDLGQVFNEVWRYVDEPDTFRFSITNSPGGVSEPAADPDRKPWWTLRAYFERGFEESGLSE